MSPRSPIVIGYRLFFAALTLAALITQLATLLQRHGSPGNFVSYFTIQSNLIAAAVFAGTAGRAGRAGIRGASTTYMTITGVVYAVLLSGATPGDDSTVGWVNQVVHRVMPVVVFLDWLLVPPDHPMSVRRALVWLLYPLGYGVYTLVRGDRVHWYPYPFLNVDMHGYGSVALYCLGIAVAAVGFVALVVFVGNLTTRKP